MHIRLTYLACLLLTGLLNPQAYATFPTVALKPVCLKQIYSPTTITYAPDGSGRLFICDQIGKIYIFQNGMLLPTPFLDITDRAVTQNTNYNERGLLGLTFHPGYANPSSPGYRKFYVNYNKIYVPGTPDFDPPPPVADHTPNCVTVIAEFQVSATNPNVADPLSERRMLRYSQPQANHKGGQLEFGPEIGAGGERYLYIAAGDGGSQQDNNVGHTGGTGGRPTNNLGNSQDKTRYLGKILRIDPLGNNGPGGQYGIPASNPFFNDVTPDLKKEIYSYGMRNPWRFSFDKRPGGTNRLFCGDVGGDRIEEINIIVSGGNYGWRYKEGLELPSFSSGASPNPMTLPPADVSAMIAPIAMYAHSNLAANDPTVLPKLGLSVTGGFVYRGAAIPALQGKYVFGDYGSTAGASDGRLMGLEETSPNSGIFTLTQALPIINSTNPIVGQRINSLGEDESGEIYLGLKTTAGVMELNNGFPAGGIYKIVPLTTGTVMVEPSKDNSMFSEFTSNSDGQGITMFAGVTGSSANYSKRRALMAFDVSAVPAGAVISSAQVQLTVSVGQGSNNPMTLRRITQPWGEGASTAGEAGGTGVSADNGDATWIHRFYPSTAWTAPGGDYSATVSATQSVSGYGTYTWTSTQLATDVQGWVTTPSTNNGWILIGDETGNTNAKRIYTREATTTSLRPKLTVNYSAAPALTRRENWLQQYFSTGQYVGDTADPEGDGIPNLIEYAYGFSPLVTNSSTSGLDVGAAESGANTVVTITFRRDPRAVDLTYALETSSDLLNWSTPPIVQSVAGGIPTGTGYVTESDIIAEAPIRLVTAQETMTSPAKKFVRLRITKLP